MLDLSLSEHVECRGAAPASLGARQERAPVGEAMPNFGSTSEKNVVFLTVMRHALAGLLLTLLVAGPLPAAEITAVWIGGSSGWFNGANWSNGTTPNNGGGDTYDVRIDLGNPAVDSVVTFNSDATIDDLTISAGDFLGITIDNTLTLTAGGTISNGGEIEVEGGATGLVFNPGLLLGDGVSFIGGGTVTLPWPYRVIGTAISTDTVTNVDNTIQGAGYIGTGTDRITLVNQGVIEANSPFPWDLKIYPSSTAGLTNSGTLRASSGRTLWVVGTAAHESVNNIGGTIEALNGSTVRLSNVNILGGTFEAQNAATVKLINFELVGGTLTTSGSGRILILNGGTSTLDGSAGGIVSNGLVEMEIGTNLNLLGTFTNNGTFDSLGSGTINIGAGTVTMNGTGTFDVPTTIEGLAGGWLVNGATHTISGNGNIGNNTISLTNEGIMESSSGTLSVDPDAGGAINNGTMRATSGGTLVLNDGTFNNGTGTIQAANGTIEITDSTVNGGTVEAISGGTLETNDATFSASSTVTIGNTGTLNTKSGTTEVNGSLQNVLGGQVILDDGTTLAIDGSGVGTSHTNDSTIDVNGTTQDTEVLISGGTVTMDGTGTMTLFGISHSRIGGTLSTDRFVNGTNHTINGTGQIGLNSIALTNQGLIDANIGAQELTIDPSSSGMINTGTLRASNGGILNLFDGLFANAGGTIESFGATEVRLGDVTIEGGTLQGAGSIQVPTTATLDGVTNTSTVAVLDGATLTLVGSMTNTGIVILESGASTGATMLTSGDVTISGSGAVVLTTNSILTGTLFTDRLTLSSGATIRGEGSLGADGMGLTNNATIEADSGTLTIDTSGIGFTNNVLVQAVNGGTLRIKETIVGNAVGTLRAFNGTTVELATGTQIQGGIFETFGTGQILITGAVTLDGTTQGTLQNNGDLIQQDGTNVTLNGTIQNDASMAITSTGTATTMTAATNTTLQGSGVLKLSNQMANELTTSGGATLTHAIGHTIDGAGTINANLVNNGTITANQTNALILAGAAKVNNGTMRASGSGTLNVNLNVSGTGRWQATGGGVVDIAGGAVISTTGTLAADTDGQLALGAASSMSGSDMMMDATGRILTAAGAELLLAGSFSFEMTDELRWDWNSTSAVQMNGGVGESSWNLTNWAQLEIGGVDLGTDPITHVGDPAGFANSNFYLPALVIGADAHLSLVDLIDNGNQGGAFGPFEALYVDTLEFSDALGQLNLNGLNLYYNTLIGNPDQIITALPGDFNLDGVVDGFDFLEWQLGNGTLYDADDLAVWNANYGSVAPLIVAASTAVPEPSTFALIAVGLLGMSYRRRKKS